MRILTWVLQFTFIFCQAIIFCTYLSFGPWQSGFVLHFLRTIFIPLSIVIFSSLLKFWFKFGYSGSVFVICLVLNSYTTISYGLHLRMNWNYMVQIFVCRMGAINMHIFFLVRLYESRVIFTRNDGLIFCLGKWYCRDIGTCTLSWRRHSCCSDNWDRYKCMLFGTGRCYH